MVRKGVRRNNLYYLKGSTVTSQVETSDSSDDGCTKVWQIKVGHEGEKSLQAPAKKGSLEGAATCNLVGEHNVLDKKKVKFSTTTHHSKDLLDCIHISIWGPAKRLHRLDVIVILSHLLIIDLGIVRYIP